MSTSVSAVSSSFEYDFDGSRQKAQVHQLKQQGESPSAIAASLGMTTATVNSILGINGATAGGVPSAALTSAPTSSSFSGPALSIFA